MIRQTRRSGLQLPDIHEVLQLILDKESPRLGKNHTWIEDNPQAFEPLRTLSASLDIEDMYSASPNVTTEAELCTGIAKTEQVKHALVNALLEDTSPSDLKVKVYKALAHTDDLSPADAIFVFGAQSNARIDKAVELFKQGYAKQIIISGRGPNWQTVTDLTEATRMSERSQELGVPAGAIILEEQALTIPDNVKRTLDLFDSLGLRPKKLIIVASSWVLLRAYIDWLRFPDSPIEIIRVAPALVDPEMSPENWHTHEKGVNLILNEYAKILLEASTNSYLRNRLT